MTDRTEAMRQVLNVRALEVVRARDTLLALEELAARTMENKGAVANALEQAREDAESAVLLWLSARAEMYRMAQLEAEVGRG